MLFNNISDYVDNIVGVIHVGACFLEERNFYRNTMKIEDILWFEANIDIYI